MEILKSIYRRNPEFIQDILHLYYFKTDSYYDTRMNDFPRLGISSKLKVQIFLTRYATSFMLEGETYKFQYESGFLGDPSQAPFSLLLKGLTQIGFSSLNIEDMYERFYKSENPLLVELSEQFKDKDISISSELFEFVNRIECNPNRDWRLNDFTTGNWNYTLLALNESVWIKSFDKELISNLFKTEKDQLDLIDQNGLNHDEYSNYLIRIDTLIKNKLS